MTEPRDRATIPPPANPTFRLTRQGAARLAELEAYIVGSPLAAGTEAECRRCGDWIDVPPGEDPNDTLCAPCADADED